MRVGIGSDDPVKQRFSKLNVRLDNETLYQLGQIIMTLVNDNQTNADNFEIYYINKDHLNDNK